MLEAESEQRKIWTTRRKTFAQVFVFAVVGAVPAESEDEKKKIRYIGLCWSQHKNTAWILNDINFPSSLMSFLKKKKVVYKLKNDNAVNDHDHRPCRSRSN